MTAQRRTESLSEAGAEADLYLRGISIRPVCIVWEPGNKGSPTKTDLIQAKICEKGQKGVLIYGIECSETEKIIWFIN